MGIKKKVNKAMFKIITKTLPLIQYWPFKYFAPVIGKLANWYIEKKFPTPKGQAPT
jgi:hypothetical protein